MFNKLLDFMYHKKLTWLVCVNLLGLLVICVDYLIENKYPTGVQWEAAILGWLIGMMPYYIFKKERPEEIHETMEKKRAQDYQDGFNDGKQAALNGTDSLPVDYLSRPMQYQIGFKDAYLNH